MSKRPDGAYLGMHSTPVEIRELVARLGMPVSCACDVRADEAPIEATVHISLFAEILTEHFQLRDVAVRRAAFTTALDSRSASDPLPYCCARDPAVARCCLIFAVVPPHAP